MPRRQYDQVVKDLRPIYTAIDADAALVALEAFEEKWGGQLPVQNAVPQWTRTRGWTKALLAFKIHFGDRLPE